MASAQFNVNYLQGGKEAVNVGYVLGNWADSNELEQVAQAIFDAWGAFIMPNLSQECAVTGVEAFDTQDVYQGFSSGTAIAGGVARPPENISSALLITKADQSSRRKGRWYIPGVPDNNTGAGGEIDPGWAANVVTSFIACDNAVQATFDAKFANRHKTSAVSTFIAPITTYGFRPFIGVQRGRRFDS